MPRRFHAAAGAAVAILSIAACDAATTAPPNTPEATAAAMTAAVADVWSAPVEVPDIGEPDMLSKHAPIVSANEHTLYFTGRIETGTDSAMIWVSRWDPVTGVWSKADPVKSVPGVTPAVNEPGTASGVPTLSRNGLRMYFSRPGPCGLRDIWVADRASAGTEEWGQAVPLPCEDKPNGVNSAQNDVEPMVDGETLYFARGIAGPSYDIYAAGPAGGPSANSAHFPRFSTPARVTALNSTAAERRPFVSTNGLEIVFASSRPNAKARLNIFIASRASRSDDWGAPVAIDAVNEASLDGGPSLSRDGSTLYFYSDRRMLGDVLTDGGIPRLWMSRRR